MRYGIYQGARNASWCCLIECRINSLPIKPIKIAKHFGIKCKKVSGSKLNGHSGEITKIWWRTYILFNKEDIAVRQRYTITHELGHYLLGHLGNKPLFRSEIEYRSEQEQAADRFAIDMLAPACVLWGLDLHTPEEIAQICEISMQSAKIRAKRMEVLYQRNKFLTHPLERQVYE